MTHHLLRLCEIYNRSNITLLLWCQESDPHRSTVTLELESLRRFEVESGTGNGGAPLTVPHHAGRQYPNTFHLSEGYCPDKGTDRVQY